MSAVGERRHHASCACCERSVCSFLTLLRRYVGENQSLTSLTETLHSFLPPRECFPKRLDLKSIGICRCARNRNFRGTVLAFLRDMNYQCQHCGQFIMGKAYRVTSEEAGVRLLDMTVCYYCFVDAQRLGLHTEEISARDSPAAARYQQSFT
jgi:hypothetical protein